MGQGHFFLLFPICIIFVSKADSGVGYLFYAVGGDGCFVRVPSQVFQYLCRPAEWRIGMYVPPDF
jgi:hypothetical protein